MSSVKLERAGEQVRVLCLFGTRPEAIKMAPLIAMLKGRPEFHTVVCVTAQHRELLDMVNASFGIEPDFDLDAMRTRQPLTALAARIMRDVWPVFIEATPDIVLVHGDTATTAVCALAAYYSEIAVGHVEAGLRTYNRRAPYPEEGNRLVVSHLADLHFAPTKSNAEALARESITDGVFITGNTVIDALAYTVRSRYEFRYEALNFFLRARPRVVVVTAHRRENLGRPLANICYALLALVKQYPDVGFVYPVHPNPAVRETVDEVLADCPRNLLLTPPLDTDDMHNLLARCDFVLTDSGGLQEEAPALGKPVLVLRSETERPEAIAAGTAKLVGVHERGIYDEAVRLLEDAQAYDRMAKAVNPYGDGRASERIADALAYTFGLRKVPPEQFDGGVGR